MGETTGYQDVGRERQIGPTWRAFQIIGFIAAVTYLVGWLMGDPTRYLTGNATAVETLTGMVSFLSPIVALIMIGLAVSPESFKPLTQRKDLASYTVLGIILVLTVAWLVNGWFTPMYEKLVTIPLDPSMVAPVPGGVFFHMVFQHWFMSFATIALVLYPDGFTTITESETPAGFQCAVVECT